MTPLMKLLLIGALGVAAAAAAVAISGAVADAVCAAVAVVSLIVFTRSAIQMAGDSGAPEEEGSTERNDQCASATSHISPSAWRRRSSP
jgi:hypothetical protein